MKERRSEPPLEVEVQGEDLESTAKLPVLDAAAMEAADGGEGEATITGSHRVAAQPAGGTAPVEGDGATARGIPVLGPGAPASYAEERARLEHQVGSFHSQVSALDHQIGELTSHISRLSGAVAEREAALEALRNSHAAQAAELDGSRAALRVSEQARAELATRESALQARLAEAEPALQESLGRVAALEHAVATQSLSLAEGGREVETLRAQVTAAVELASHRATELAGLSSRLAAIEAQAAASQADGERREAEARRRIDQLGATLAAQHEALSNAEARRGVWEGLLLAAESARAGEVEQALGEAADGRGQLESIRAERDTLRTQLAELLQRSEAASAAAAAREGELLAKLATLQQSLAATQARAGELEAGAGEAQRELAALRSQAGESGEQARTASARVEELEASLAAARLEHAASLEAARGEHAAALQAAHGEHQAALHVAQLRHDEAQLTAQRSQDAAQQALRAELEAARRESAAQAAELTTLRADNAALRERVQALETDATREAELERASALRGLQSELRRNGDRVGELEADLRAAEDQIHRLESELRAKGPRRDDAAARGAAAANGANGPAEAPAAPAAPHDPAPDPAAALETAFSGAGATASADGITRYFVLTEGDTEIVHPLGRRTTIGRGLDNDIRIDTKYISRHHAVLLAGPNQTVLEDLRSTNGVMVNGRRTGRATLRDGDIVHIGRTKFRFVQRHRER